jgi:plasmid stabilization system protein ParE
VATLQPLGLRFSARARAQLLAIQEYIEERNPSAAIRVGASIRAAAELLRLFPYAGRAGRSPGSREWVVRGLPYILVYRVDFDNDEVMILGVFHGAQRRE